MSGWRESTVRLRDGAAIMTAVVDFSMLAPVF